MARVKKQTDEPEPVAKTPRKRAKATADDKKPAARAKRAKSAQESPKDDTKTKTAKTKMGRQTKYCPELVERICEMYEQDTYSVAEVCAAVGIGHSSYHLWMSEYPDFAEAVKSAKLRRMDSLVIEAEKSLRKKIMGYSVEEVKTESVPGKPDPVTGRMTGIVKKRVVTTKHFEPDTGAIIFTLTNGDPDRWKNRQNTEITGKDGKGLFERMTDEELLAEIAELKRKLSTE